MILQFSKSFIDSWVCWHSLFDAFVTSKQCPHLNHGRHRQQGLRRTFLSCSQSLGSLVPEPYCSQRKARSWWYTLTGEWVSALPMYPELGDPELGFCWQCDHQSVPAPFPEVLAGAGQLAQGSASVHSAVPRPQPPPPGHHSRPASHHIGLTLTSINSVIIVQQFWLRMTPFQPWQIIAFAPSIESYDS